jgi:hypothetical protein
VVVRSTNKYGLRDTIVHIHEHGQEGCIQLVPTRHSLRVAILRLQFAANRSCLEEFSRDWVSAVAVQSSVVLAGPSNAIPDSGVMAQDIRPSRRESVETES